MYKIKTIKKLINTPELRQNKLLLYIKNDIVPVVKSYLKKTTEVLVTSLIILLCLRFLNYEVTLYNFISSVALYFVIEEIKTFILVLRLGKKK